MIAAFDLDGTLLKNNSSMAFCNYLRDKGMLSRSDLYFCTYIYVRHLYFSLSLWDMHSLIFERLFRGRHSDVLAPLVEAFLEENLEKMWYYPALLRLRCLQKRGFKSMILSNSPSFLVRAIGEKIGIQKVFATEYQCDSQGLLCGISSLMDGARKAEVITQFPSKKIIAFSDSPLDLVFLRAAHVAVVVNPKNKLKRIARKEGWEIL